MTFGNSGLIIKRREFLFKQRITFPYLRGGLTWVGGGGI